MHWMLVVIVGGAAANEWMTSSSFLEFFCWRTDFSACCIIRRCLIYISWSLPRVSIRILRSLAVQTLTKSIVLSSSGASLGALCNLTRGWRRWFSGHKMDSNKQTWWCEGYGVCFAFEDDAVGNQACNPLCGVPRREEGWDVR